jgi:hypothetical protein
MSSLLKNQNTP